MHFTSSRHISQKGVQPVAESPRLPEKTTPGTYAAYRAFQDAEIQKRKNQQGTDQNSDNGQDAADPEESIPEIFKLLKKYRFKDFFRLCRSKDEFTLFSIVKQRRKMRGVSRALPVSTDHNQNKPFIKQFASEYVSSGWLMKAKPGQAYSGML